MSPELPIPISLIASHYLVFSVDAVIYLRSEHHILGVLTGSLPQCPQQNVFLGIPLELMPEEARLLVDAGVCYIVNELKLQQKALEQSPEERQRRLRDLEGHVGHQRQMFAEAAEKRKRYALQRNPNIPQSGIISEGNRELRVTLTASQATPPPPAGIVPAVPASYPLFRHLHDAGYFMSPGLRFGSNYMAYPGDPLRYHSHFVCVSLEQGEEAPLLDIVGGGRLGTGVKKAFLLGGQVDDAETVRTFCIEWGGM